LFHKADATPQCLFCISMKLLNLLHCNTFLRSA
jgi:hypothetical protein